MTDQRRPNPAQEFAINQIDSNIAVTAGAGSGKTTVLVGRYLKLLESGLPVSQLVAITFTRKAAAEMSARLRLDLEERLKTTTDPAHKRLLTIALQEMNAARISTIHSLCGDIVRANAAACGVDPSFTVLDEVQSKLAFNHARDRVLRTLGAHITDDAAGQAAVRVIHEYGLNGVKGSLTIELTAQATTSSNSQTASDILAEWLAAWQTEMVQAIQSMLASPEIQAFYDISITDPTDKLSEYILSHRQALDRLKSSPTLETFLVECGELKMTAGNVGSAKAWGDKETLKEIRGGVAKAPSNAVRELMDIFGTSPDDDAHREAAELLIGWRELIGRIANEYQVAKRRQNALDFNDLERLAALALTDDSVAARYRTQFAHVMVDEFQDTSAAQWDIIRRIAPPDQPGRLFIVGDPKQSIYGFRGSDHSVFTNATNIIRASGQRQTPPVPTAVSLSTSYRTHKPLLDALNTLFQNVMTVPNKTAGYVPFESLDAGRTDISGTAPFFHVRTFDTDQPIIHGIEKWTADTVRPQEATDVALQIVELITAGDLMYGDIAILCRTGTYFGLFEDAMRAHNIPYITTAGRGYFNRPEVTDLIGLLSALYNDADHLALAAVLRSPLFSLSDSALYALRKAGDSLWGVLTADVPPDDFPADELPALDFARSVLSDLKTRTRRARIADILREALEATHYLAFLESQAHGIQSRANVQKLVEQAETSGVVTLSQFLNYIEQVKSAEARESDAALDAENAVQLMTIHASKGLEFKVVFLPMTNDHTNQDNEVVKAHPILGLVCKLPNRDGDSFKPFPFRHAKHIKQAKEDAEALRLFYVAATRVKNLLILSGSYNVSKDGKIGSTGRMSHLLDHQPTLTGTHGTHVSYSDITARVLPRTAHAIGGRTLPQIDDSIIPVTPPLFHTIPSRVIDRAKHVTTTDLSHLSQSRNAPTAEERKQAGGRFRRGVLGQSDSPIRFLTAGIQSSRAPSRVVGEVVHEAIRFGYDSEADDELRALLQSLVWSQPIGPDLHADAVARALDLIGRYRQSTLSNDIHLSPTVYREIPFVYDLNDIIIHGQIDLLYRDAHRVWTLVDYKTDYIPRGGDIRTHSQRHLTQLAVYARAVRERLNLTQDAQTLQVKLHYLSVNTTVDLSDTELESALIGGLSALVSQTLTQEDDHA